MTVSRCRDRFIRIMPGRIRVEFFGLLHSKETEISLAQTFANIRGVKKAEPSSATGRILIIFEERQISGSELLRYLEELELERSGQRHEASAAPQSDAPAANEGSIEADPEAEIARREAAVGLEAAPDTFDSIEENTSSSSDSNGVPESLRTIPIAVSPRSASPPGVPLPLAVAMGGLVVLGAKQLFFGRSALARSPIPFYLSGLVAVVTGYPFLRRGFSRLAEEKKLNPDLLLGTAALSLALVRENVVVLAAMSILQYVNWKRSQIGITGTETDPLSPEIRAYSEKAGKLGVAAAGATWLLTRDPLRGIAVLLAANPRPATIPGKAAWQQAELYSRESQSDAPAQGSLSRLARTSTIMLEDTSLLLRSDIHETECVSHEEDPDKVICLSASLLEKSAHSWKEDVRAKAKQTCRTVRTAFRVEESETGISGMIGSTPYCIGNLAYCRQKEIPFERYYLEAKRMENKGYEALYVAKMTNHGWLCLGLVCRAQQFDPERRNLLERLRQQGFRLTVLGDRAAVGSDAIAKLGIGRDWLDVHEHEAIERIAVLHQQGEDVLLVTGDREVESSRYLLEAGVQGVPIDRLDDVLETRLSAKKIETAVNEHFQLTKKWNLVGSALAAIGALSAPIANLAGDALSLMFMSRSQKLAESAFSSGPLHDTAAARHEVAAASAALAETAAWHGMPWESITDRFQVSQQSGLTGNQVSETRSRHGFNQLEQKQSTPWLVSYLGQFKEFTTLILLGTSVLALLTGGLFDGLAMGAVLLANAAIGTIQERKAEKVVESLNRFQPPECTVVRDGAKHIISAVELVPGDIVCLEPGDRVPADLRLIRAWNLEVNEAALTGESVPVIKQEGSLLEDCPLSERKNMLYMGTDISRGKALAVVVQTGMDTEIGHLMSLLKTDEKITTPLQERVTSISKTFVKWALIAGGVVFVAGLLRGVPLAQMVGTSITLAASAIPEGLPVTITIALSAGIFRMAKKNALVRKLSALETLGRTTVICSDKTGTLTKNEMTVKEIAAVHRAWHVTGNGYDPQGDIRNADSEEDPEDGSSSQPELQRILQVAYLCNNSKLDQQDGYWGIKGDPTEGALLTLAYKGGVTPERMSMWHRGAEVPFDSGTGKMSVVCRDAESGADCCVFSKGSVESILRHCSRYQQDGQVYPLTDGIRERIMNKNEELAGGALRVLGFAYRPLSADEHDQQPGLDENNMIYIGMAGMMDPPKSDVEQSIREAFALGVKPVMITGDHPITAIAIARQIGICDGTGKVLSGHELDRLTEPELEQLVDEVSIFARMTPEHKLRIVNALQRKGHIVAMTGDGVNDTPAIKQADIGIAMGRTGTEVSKGTADMVLKEDHFGSIVEGVKEGRTIIGNIRKALGCLLTGNLAEILVTSAAVIAGMPIPLVPIQILLMNLLTDALPAMILAVNPGNKTKLTKRTDIVDKQLYRKVVTRGVLLGIGSLGLFGLSLAAGQPVQVAQSIAFATLVAGQLIQTFSWRQEGTEETIADWRKDRFLIGALGISWLALLSALYVPPFNRIFHTAPIALHHWGPILVVAASVSIFSKPILALLSGKDRLVPPAQPAYSAA